MIKILFDMLPVILFFATYKLAGSDPQATSELLSGSGILLQPAQAPILLATAVTILATLLQIAWVRWRTGRVERMMWISLGLITVLGGLTLAFRNPDFIKWKPTVLYWIFAAALSGTLLLLGKNLIRSMLEAQLALPDAVWLKLNHAWSLFFIAMGALNLFVAYRFSEEAWVNFKMFGGLGLMFAFVLGQGVYLSRHIKEENVA
jgi:intracellular septation protein